MKNFLFHPDRWDRAAKFSVLLLFAVCHLTHAQSTVPQDLDLSTATETHVDVIDVSNLAVPGKTYVAATLMKGSVQKLCSVIMNYSEYPQFMPNTEKTTIVSKEDDATVIEMTLGLPLGKIKKYRLQMASAITPEYCQLSWKLVPWEGLQASETIADTSGYWQLTPYPKDKNKTLVKYYVFADPGPVPYGLGWIVDVITRISLPRTLEALRERVTVK
jgi:hypothetical protein